MSSNTWRVFTLYCGHPGTTTIPFRLHSNILARCVGRLALRRVPRAFPDTVTPRRAGNTAGHGQEQIETHITRRKCVCVRETEWTYMRAFGVHLINNPSNPERHSSTKINLHSDIRWTDPRWRGWLSAVRNATVHVKIGNTEQHIISEISKSIEKSIHKARLHPCTSTVQCFSLLAHLGRVIGRTSIPVTSFPVLCVCCVMYCACALNAYRLVYAQIDNVNELDEYIDDHQQYPRHQKSASVLCVVRRPGEQGMAEKKNH